MERRPRASPPAAATVTAGTAVTGDAAGRSDPAGSQPPEAGIGRRRDRSGDGADSARPAAARRRGSALTQTHAAPHGGGSSVRLLTSHGARKPTAGARAASARSGEPPTRRATRHRARALGTGPGLRAPPRATRCCHISPARARRALPAASSLRNLIACGSSVASAPGTSRARGGDVTATRHRRRPWRPPQMASRRRVTGRARPGASEWRARRNGRPELADDQVRTSHAWRRVGSPGSPARRFIFSSPITHRLERPG